jgi:molybdopterin molybdotransferase/putative molybdopterin biosynthesis protein
VTRKNSRAATPAAVENRLRERRRAAGLSQGTLAERAGLTRQAVYAVESNRYLPNAVAALRLARVLGCRVEDLFSLEPYSEIVEAEVLRDPAGSAGRRVKLWRVGGRRVAVPVATLGENASFTQLADGLLVETPRPRKWKTGSGRRTVLLLRERDHVEEQIVVAGCDPAIGLLIEHLRRRREPADLVSWTTGSLNALRALKSREIHVAGLHLVDARSGLSNVPFLRRHLRGRKYEVVTFASWEAGLMVGPGNPKGIRGFGDLVRPNVTLANREPGAGARLLLDEALARDGIPAHRVKGYGTEALSHFEVARLVASGRADVGIGVLSVARFFGLPFLPVRTERYDLVVPSDLLRVHPTLARLFDALTSRELRAQVQALGGYDTRETGRRVSV